MFLSLEWFMIKAMVLAVVSIAPTIITTPALRVDLQQLNSPGAIKESNVYSNSNNKITYNTNNNGNENVRYENKKQKPTEWIRQQTGLKDIIKPDIQELQISQR